MKLVLKVLWVSAIVALWGCHVPADSRREYHAVITDVEDMPGRHYSTARGEQPQTRMWLRVISPAARRHFQVKLSVLDFVSGDQIGRIGDEVSFRFVGPLPIDGELWMEQVTEYKVLGKKG